MTTPDRFAKLFFMKSKFPAVLTSYDLFKTFAVLTMIVDHVGYYFFPEEMWWRAVGRLSAPMWLFLIGYARSRDLSPMLLIGAGVLVLASGVMGPSLMPTNILVNIIIIRLVLDQFAARMLRSPANFIEIGVLILIAAVPTAIFTDYGTAGLMIAIFGYAIRKHQDGETMFKDAVPMAGVFAFLIFYGLILISFTFTMEQKILSFVGVGGVLAAMAVFKGVEYPKLTAAMPKPITLLLQFFGRYSLEIYVGHLLLFKMAALYMGLQSHSFWSWKILS